MVQFDPDGNWRVVLCNGMVRSASTWSYNVVIKLLRAALGEGVYGGYNEDISQFLASAPPTATYRVLKCHTLDTAGRRLAESGEAKVIFTCRNLADASVSFMRMFHYDFEHTFSALQSSLELYRFHQRGRKALILGYQEITARPLESVTKIAEYLGVTAPGEILERVTEETSADRARERVEQLKEQLKTQGEPDRLVHVDRFIYDPETLLNLDHIRDGRSGYGRASLTDEQVNRIDTLAKRYEFNVE
jgi:hypothetical protein